MWSGERKWSARVRLAVTVLLEYFDAYPGAARMCVVETLRAGPAVLERRRRVLGVLTAAVDEGRAEAKHGNEPLPLTAEGVVGGALAVVHARLLACAPTWGVPRHTPQGTGGGLDQSSSSGASGDSVRGTSRGRESDDASLVGLANALTGMILYPYTGPAAARREFERPAPRPAAPVVPDGPQDPFKGLSIRFTYRTARVLATISEDGGASNRTVAAAAGIGDEGQMSRLLRRLQDAGLIENLGEGHTRGEPNAWWLTQRGEAIHATLAGAQTTAVASSR